LEAYLDQNNIPTIGWGHVGPEVKIGLVWTQAQADSQLSTDLAHAENSVRAVVHTAIGAQSIGALISLAFNIGVGAFEGSTVLKLVNGAQHILAAKAYLNWDHVNQVEDKGLLRRRLDEASLYLLGV